MTISRWPALLAGLLLAGLVTSAAAAEYPSREITFIVPYGTGGSTDPVSRQFADNLEKVLKVDVVVENRPGGSATIGTTAVVLARPDGYTIGLSSNSALANQTLLKKNLKYDTPADYQPLVKLVDLPAVLAVRADAPWKTFADFMAAVKKDPGKIRASVSGARTAPDLSVQELNRVAGVKITTVPFSGGGGEALRMLLAGQVEANVGYPISVKGQVDAGKVRVLAVFNKVRIDLFPDAVTTVESGYNVTLPAMYCVIAPKGLPDDVRATLIEAARKAAADEAMVAFAKANGYTLDPKGPDELAAEINEYRQVYADLLKFLDTPR